MSMFKNLSTDNLETQTDQLGGFTLFDSGLYPAKIKMIYITTSDNGAMAANLVAELEGGKEYRETFWITNKKGENFYLNKQDSSKKVPLPGFTHINDIALITTGSPLAELDSSEKVVRLWDREAGALVARSVPCIDGVEDGEIILAIQKTLANKTEKQADNSYAEIAETREYNEVNKVFHPETRQTIVEAMNGQDASFIDSWEKRNKDVTRDARKIKDGQGATPGKPPVTRKPAGAPASAPAASKPMFGKRG